MKFSVTQLFAPLILLLLLSPSVQGQGRAESSQYNGRFESVDSDDITSVFEEEEVVIPIPTPRPAIKSPLTSKVAGPRVQLLEPLEITNDYKFAVPRDGIILELCMGQDQYFNGNGTLGKKGKILKRELTQEPGAKSTPMKHLFFRNKFPKMEKLCPKFDSFSDNQKLNFWIWYFAATASKESRCGRDEYRDCDPHGTSIGELQMPDSDANLSWRGIFNGAGGCKPEPPPALSQSKGWIMCYRKLANGKTVTYKKSTRNRKPTLMSRTENSLSCGVEVLAGFLCGFYDYPAESCKETTVAPYGRSFWSELKRGESSLNGPIGKEIRKFPLCN